MGLKDTLLLTGTKLFGLMAQEQEHHNPVKTVTPGMPELLREAAAAGAVLAEVWVDGVTMPVVDGLGDEFLDYVRDGMKITVKANGIVEVEE